MEKKFTKREWEALEVVVLPTPTSGQVRWYNGDCWEWKSSGKYVIAQKVYARKK